ncbi:primase alpha helix C-terminal domain-containing protein [Branchiibius cervicis]|uniref:Primase alpha helix C-terminal domain-containing protein n=1 Tax=Branchiibius cervicis TaxID=908252 RepID=A0ABW2AVT8_9MICO
MRDLHTALVAACWGDRAHQVRARSRNPLCAFAPVSWPRGDRTGNRGAGDLLAALRAAEIIAPTPRPPEPTPVPPSSVETAKWTAGQRNSALFDYVRVRAYRGDDPCTIAAQANSQFCNPPLPAAEVETIARSIDRFCREHRLGRHRGATQAVQDAHVPVPTITQAEGRALGPAARTAQARERYAALGVAAAPLVAAGSSLRAAATTLGVSPATLSRAMRAVGGQGSGEGGQGAPEGVSQWTPNQGSIWDRAPAGSTDPHPQSHHPRPRRPRHRHPHPHPPQPALHRAVHAPTGVGRTRRARSPPTAARKRIVQSPRGFGPKLMRCGGCGVRG